MQLLAPSLAKFGPLGAREFEVFDLPYMFDSNEELHKVTEGPAGKALFKKLESKGITGLAYWDNGFKIMTSNKPMKTPADMRGQKIRIQSSQVLSAQMKALGALPQTMAFSEVYQAMQTGVVDGGENTPSNVYTQKMHEVQKHATHDQPRLHRLRGHHQQEVLGRPAGRHPHRPRGGHGRGHQVRERDRAGGERRRARKDQGVGQDRGLHADRGRARRVEEGAGKVHTEMESRIGKDTIQAVYKETGFKPD